MGTTQKPKIQDEVFVLNQKTENQENFQQGNNLIRTGLSERGEKQTNKQTKQSTAHMWKWFAWGKRRKHNEKLTLLLKLNGLLRKQMLKCYLISFRLQGVPKG